MAKTTRTCRTQRDLDAAIAEIRAAFARAGQVEIAWHTEKRRTLAQNAALHLWCRQLADLLNESGHDMRRVIREEVDIPWTAASVKEYLWRPVQTVMLQKESTADANRTDYTYVYDTICRHLGQRLGIECPPWPTRDETC